jgi:hypothetical protein
MRAADIAKLQAERETRFRINPRQPADLVKDRAHGVAYPEEAVKGIEFQSAFLGDADGGPSLLAIAVQRHLDGCAQRALVERLDEVAVGTRCLGAPQRPLIGKRREKDDRRTRLFADFHCGFDPLHRAFELDVHEHEIGPQFNGFRDRLTPGRHDGRDFVAQLFEQVSQIFCDDCFVFDHENARCGHR